MIGDKNLADENLDEWRSLARTNQVATEWPGTDVKSPVEDTGQQDS